MAPKKKINDKPPKPTIKRTQKPRKPFPKTVEVKIGSSVALALLQAESSRISPKQAKALAKQTNSPNTVKKPVRKCTPVTKKYVNKKTENHGVDDSVTPQEQLHTRVTRRYVSETIEKHSVNVSVAPQKQLYISLTRNCVNKTTEKYSVDDSVTQREQLHTPLTGKYDNETTALHSVDNSETVQEQKKKRPGPKSSKKTKRHRVDDSVTQQGQLHTPFTRKYISKTIDKHSVDKSVTPQEQLHTPVTKISVNKTIDKHSVYDSLAPQKQLNSSVTKKCVSKTTEKDSIGDSVTQQEQLHTPVTRMYDNKTTEVHSVDDSETVQEEKKKRPEPKSSKTIKRHSEDDSVTQQEHLHTPFTRKYINKTTEKHSVDKSVTPQEQLHTPVTKNYVNKTIDKHSVDDSLAQQEQFNCSVTKKCVSKTTEVHSVDDSETVQEQKKKRPGPKSSKTIKRHSEDDSVTQQEHLHTRFTRKYINKTTEKHSVDKSVTPQEQLHTPVTKNCVNKTIDKHSVDDSLAPHEQFNSSVTKKCVSKTTEKDSVDDSVTQQEQIHTPVTRKYDNKTTEVHSVDDSETVQVQKKKIPGPKSSKTTEKHSVDDSVPQQEQLHTPDPKQYVNKTTDKHNVDDSVAPQKQLYTPVTRKYDNKTTEVQSVDDSETVQEQKKKRPGPKSRTLLEVMKKPVTLDKKAVTKAKNKPTRKKQQSVKSANISQEIGPDNSSDILSKEGLAASEGRENVAATPIKRLRGRSKESTLAKSKILNENEIKNAAPMLEKASENPSQPNNRPNSVTSNKSNLTWTKDISTESSISSGTTTSVTVTSNDCEHFNNELEQLKIPDQLKVKNDNLKPMYTSVPEISENESSSSDSESSSSSSSSSDSELGGADTMPELNLSTSSLTPKSPISGANTDRRRIENIHKVIEDFRADIKTLWPHNDDYCCTDSAVLKGLDPEIDDLIEKCDNFDSDLEAIFQETNNSEKFEYKTVKSNRTPEFTEQNDSEIRSFEDSRRSSYEASQKSVHNDSEGRFAKPCLFRRVSAANSRDTTINVADKQLVSNINRVEASPTDSFKTFTSDNYNYVPFDRTHDDEDALSLYAESISGMESSKLDSVASVSNVSVHDVYVPTYSPTCMREKYVYRPTKIQVHKSNLSQESIEEGEIISNKDDQDQELGTKPKEISRACVSSSGTSATNKTTLGLMEDSNRTSSIADESIKRSEAQISSQPLRPFSSYIPMNPIKSSLYRGVCFFYIAYQCKNSNCRFPHVIIDPNTFKCRLALLNDCNLISEYLLICVYGSLKRKFCMLFVDECIRRTATRILFEMAIDLGLGFDEIDEDLRVAVLETTLLHLNTISLDACVDLLKFEHKDTMMCDALLSCMANSQNFAQFKQAFVKLANLTCELNRPVDIQVVSSILERVCILPGEDFLARGMLVLMKNTDVSIFDNSLATLFEVQLSNIDSNVHKMYLLAKRAALKARLAQPDDMHPATALLMPRVAQGKPQQTSPDSTNMDNVPEPLLPLNSAPRRFVEPTQPLWRRSGYNTRGHHHRRGRMPPGVYPKWYVLHDNCKTICTKPVTLG